MSVLHQTGGARYRLGYFEALRVRDMLAVCGTRLPRRRSATWRRCNSAAARRLVRRRPQTADRLRLLRQRATFRRARAGQQCRRCTARARGPARSD